MMNPSEIDAGPPNKKPKMVGGASTNGYQTQMSESKEQMFAAIESDFPDELVTENEYPTNTYHQPITNNYVNDTLSSAPQQASQFQMKPQQQQPMQYKIINGPQQIQTAGSYQQASVVQQQQQQQANIHLTNSPNRAASTGPSPMGMNNSAPNSVAANSVGAGGVGNNYQMMNTTTASNPNIMQSQQAQQSQQQNLKPAVTGQLINTNFQQAGNANYHKIQQPQMQTQTGAIKNPNAANNGATTNSSASPAAMQSVPMNTTFHAVGNVNINNINIHIQPNSGNASTTSATIQQQQQHQQQQQQGRYSQPQGMYNNTNALNQPSPSTTPSNSIAATIAGVASGAGTAGNHQTSIQQQQQGSTTISANATNIRPILTNNPNLNRTIINSNPTSTTTTLSNQNIIISNSIQQQRPTLNQPQTDMNNQHDRFNSQINTPSSQMNGGMGATGTFVNRPQQAAPQQQGQPTQTIHLQGPSSIRQQLLNGPNAPAQANATTNHINSNPMPMQLGNAMPPNANTTNNMVVNSNNAVNSGILPGASQPSQAPGGGTNAAPGGTGAPNSSNEQEKRKLIQQQLVLLLHAHKCSQRSDRQCQVPHCSTMRGVLAHMTQCNEGRNCTVAHCASSRQIIGHWKNCTKPDCPVCYPLRNQNNTLNNQRTGGAPGQPVPNSQPGQNRPMSNATLGGPVTGPDPVGLSASVPTASQTSTVLMQHQPQQPREHKPWHEKITTDMRRHLVQKIVQTIFPTQDPNIYRDPRLTNLVNYAVKTECEMYEQARDQEEYFHLLAERIYKIQKEFEDKTRSRNNRGTPGGAGNSVNSGAGDNGLMSSTGSDSIFVCNPDLSAGNGGPPNKVAPSDSSKPFNGPSSLNRGPLDPFKINPPNTKLASNSTSVLSNQLFKSEFDSSLFGGSQPGAANSLTQSPSHSSIGNANANAAHLPQQPKLFNDPNHLPMSNTGAGLASATATLGSSSSLDSFNSNFTTLNKIDSAYSKKDDIMDVKLEIKAESADKLPGDSSLSIKTEPNEIKNELISPNKTATSIKAEGLDDSSAGNADNSINANPPSNLAANTVSPNKAAAAAATPATPSIATTTKGANNKPTIKFPAEYLREKLLPTFERMYKEQDAIAFQNPVDPAELQLHDYFDIIKKPMDLSTIRKKLDEGKYSNPQEYVDDVWLMFNNAWLYNKKTSKVYKCCTKLSEIFSACIDPVMKEMGYCCGQQYTFSPQVMFCYGNQMCCTIPRDGVYYLYNNTNQSQPNANCDKYTYCIKCFDAIKSDTAPIGDDPSQPLIEVKKSLFVQMKNDHEEPEAYVECADCGRRWHQICALYMEQIFNKFVCETCNKEKGLAANTRNNQFTSNKLMNTQLGDFLENRVNSYLSRNSAAQSSDHQQAGRVTIRILSSVDKVCEVKSMMKQRFEGELNSEQFPFKTKAIFAFEEIDGTDVVFFGMHVQEYGSECSPPNTRRVYISYLDSVFFFRPKELRTAVYHEILIGYLDYVKQLGYQWAHIWACPPSEGDDYIFHCHPTEQKVPKPKRLQDWYKKMLDKGIIERVVIDYKDIHKDAIENGMKHPTDIPYFEGDFWPNVLEECIKESEQEEEKRRKEEAEAAIAAANDDFSVGGDDTYGDGADATSKDGANTSNGKKKNLNNQQKKKNIKNKMSQRKSVKKVGSSSTDLMTKILSTMEKHKEVFFVIRLLDSKQVAQMGPIIDKDPSISCDLMNGRDEFLNFARDKHHEFSTLRRAKYSTMALLYELHNQNNEKFVYTCNNCKTQMDARFHCTTCEDFDLCPACYESKGHVHKMEKLVGPGPGAGAGSSDSSKNANDPNKALDAKQQQQKTKPYIEMYLATFMHAVNCRNANCTYPKCMQFKRVVQHSKQCQKYKNSQCEFCRQLIALCIYHAKGCKDDNCQVPFCSSIKIKLKQQKALNSQAERRRMIKMNKTLRQSANMNMVSNAPASPPGGGGGDDAAAGPSTSMQAHGGMVPQGVMAPGMGPGMAGMNAGGMQPGQQHVIQQSPSSMPNGGPMHQSMMQPGHPQGMNNMANNYQVGNSMMTGPINSPQTMNYQQQPQQGHNANMYAQQQPPQQFQSHPMHSQSASNIMAGQPGQYGNQQSSPYHQQNMHQQHIQQQSLMQQQTPPQQHLITSSSSPSLMGNTGAPQQQHGNNFNVPQQQQPIQQHQQGNLMLNNSNPITTSSPTPMSSFINSNPMQQQGGQSLIDSPGKANIIQMQQQPQQAPGGMSMMNTRPQQLAPSPSPSAASMQQNMNVGNFNQNPRMINPGSNATYQMGNDMNSGNMAGNAVNSSYAGGYAVNANSNGGQMGQGQAQYPQQTFVGNQASQPQMVAANTGAPIQNQQGAQPATTTASSEYVASLIDRLKTATNQQDKQSILFEIKTVAPAVYQKLVHQNQQQIILRQQQQAQQQQQQQRQINAGGNVMPGGQNAVPGVNMQMAQQPQQTAYVQQPQQPQQQQWNNQAQMQQGQHPQQQYMTVQGQPQQQQQQQQQPIRYSSQPMTGQQMQQQQPRQMMMTNVVGQPQQQQMMQPQQMGQPRMMGVNQQQQQPQQMGMPQQRMMQPQQMGQQQIRPNVYAQQGMHVQQQHYQDPQMMNNQTRDQMLLQQPPSNQSLMSSPNQNPNQHMNPTDKLTQVVDNL